MSLSLLLFKNDILRRLNDLCTSNPKTRIMNKLVLVFLLNLTSFYLFAQNPMQRPGGAGNGQQMNGRMYGKVVEAQSGKPVEAASVQLVQSRMDTAKKKRCNNSRNAYKGQWRIFFGKRSSFWPIQIKDHCYWF